MATQIAGFTVGNIMEVEANTRAARVTLRPVDIGSLGAYSLAASNGASAMAAGLSAGSPIFAFRYPGANLALVRKVIFGAGDGATGFAAGGWHFDMFRATGFSASDTGGTDITPATGKQRLRTSFADSGLVGTTGACRISATGTLTAGTRTLDSQPMAVLAGGVGTGIGAALVNPPVELWRVLPGEMPLVLAQNEGFVIQATVPGTGVWFFGVGVVWDEVSSF